MDKLKIIVDSSSCLDIKKAEEFGVSMFPFNILLDDDTYKDQIDIELKTFYDKLKKSKQAKTSVPSPHDFLILLNKLIDEGYNKFIVITISKKLSGMNSMINLAFSQCKKDITYNVIDSYTTGPTLAIVSKIANEYYNETKDFNNTCEFIKKSFETAELYALIRDLKFLARGGRIPKSISFIGNLVALKPIVYIEDGVINTAKKVKGKKKSLEDFIRITKEVTSRYKKYAFIVLHADSDDELPIYKDEIKDIIDKATFTYECLFPSVIGVHVGPLALGFSIIELP